MCLLAAERRIMEMPQGYRQYEAMRQVQSALLVWVRECDAQYAGRQMADQVTMFTLSCKLDFCFLRISFDFSKDFLGFH